MSGTEEAEWILVWVLFPPSLFLAAAGNTENISKQSSKLAACILPVKFPGAHKLDSHPRAAREGRRISRARQRSWLQPPERAGIHLLKALLIKKRAFFLAPGGGWWSLLPDRCQWGRPFAFSAHPRCCLPRRGGTALGSGRLGKLLAFSQGSQGDSGVRCSTAPGGMEDVKICILLFLNDFQSTVGKGDWKEIKI